MSATPILLVEKHISLQPSFLMFDNPLKNIVQEESMV